MAGRGRPSSYTPEIAAEICERLMGGESLRSICAEDGMPSQAGVFKWLASGEHPDLVENYTRAREVQAHICFEETREIVDAGDDPVSARLRYDQRKWAAGRLLPKVYGDKLQHTGDGGGAVAVVMQVVTGVPRDGDSSGE